MGCTGSKPHLLLSSTISSHHNHSAHHHHHHHQSPQKGFILFNEKTFDYLKDNELEIKQKLIKRCEQKILTTSLDPKQQLLLIQAANASSSGGGTIGTSSISRALFSNAKRSLLPSLNEDKVKPNETTPTTANGVASVSVNGTPTTPTTTAASNTTNASSSPTTNTKFKEMAIDAAVDYVLKYAINDFDIDNFKSSNHLSLKQIRKDIMKKTNNRESLTKISQALGNGNSNGNNKTAIQHDMAYYKLALHTAIDEFGSFIQENFIVINEYQKKPEDQKSDELKVNGAIETTEGAVGAAISDEESLKLKEALELARQNFYKGKMSMVCLNKAGGYVVKEITEPTLDSLNTSTTSGGKIMSSVTVDSLASTSLTNNPHMSTSPTTSSDLLMAAQQSASALSTSKSFNQSFNSSNCSDNKSQQTLPKINIEDVDTRQQVGVELTTSPQQHQSNGISKSESVVSNMSVKSLRLDGSDSQLSNSELNKLLNNTIELIVTYSTKSASELRTVHAGDLGDQLEASLRQAGKLIGGGSTSSSSSGHIDQQVVQNLDHVNKEFKNYLDILNESERLELKNISAEFEEASKESIDKFVKRNSVLLELSSQLDLAIVNAKSSLAMSTSSSSHSKVTASSGGKKNKSKKTTPAPPPPTTNNESIDIRKEIAISILNVGEVLAKTIDYYTLSDGGSAVSQSSANNQQVVGAEGGADGKKHSEELKELIRLSEEQAEMERKQRGLVISKSDKESSPKSEEKQQPESMNELLEGQDQHGINNNNETMVNTKPVSNSASTTSSSPSFLSTPSPSASTAPSTPGSVSPITLPNGGADHHDLIKSMTQEDSEPVQHCTTTISSDNVANPVATQSQIEDTDILVNEFVSSIIDQAACTTTTTIDDEDVATKKETNGVVYRSSTQTTSIKQNGSGSKRVSLDEELMYQLEQVDKKVKYMNETCSENESDGESDDEDRYYDHDLNYNRHQRATSQPKGSSNNNHSQNGGGAEYNEDLDDENFDYDESVELGGATGTPARQTATTTTSGGLKQARTPAKIKSDIRQHRAVDLHEEIKQISNVIQDLVQTINVRNSTSQSNVNTLGGSSSSSSTNSQTAHDERSEQVHSLSSGSQSSTDCIDNSKSIDSNSSSNHNKNGHKAKFSTTHSFSSIPIRQKTSSSSLIKSKAMSVDADTESSTVTTTNTTSSNSQLPAARVKASPNRNSFDASHHVTPDSTPERPAAAANSKSAPNSAHSANRVFKSKLPVKK